MAVGGSVIIVLRERAAMRLKLHSFDTEYGALSHHPRIRRFIPPRVDFVQYHTFLTTFGNDLKGQRGRGAQRQKAGPPPGARTGAMTPASLRSAAARLDKGIFLTPKRGLPSQNKLPVICSIKFVPCLLLTRHATCQWVK